MRNWLLVGWAVLTVVVLAVATVLEVLEFGEVSSWPWPLGLMAFPVAATLILVKRPGHGVGRALGVVALAVSIIFVLSGLDRLLLDPETTLSLQREAISNLAVIPMWGGMIALLYVFPTGRTLNAGHARVLVVLMWLLVGLGVLQLLVPGPIPGSERPNPFGIAPDWTRPVYDVGLALLPLSALGGIGSLVIRWRHAGTMERAQLRWFLAGAVALLILLVWIAYGPEVEAGLVGTISRVFVALALWSLPAAIVRAITRYRLYEIDRLISRTVTYTVVVGVLGAVFAGGVLILGPLLPLQENLAVAASTLAATVLFNPLRRRVKEWVDRRFNRARYDAAQVIDAFGSRLRDEVDLKAIHRDLVDVASQTMEPERVSLWLRGEDALTKGDSG